MNANVEPEITPLLSRRALFGVLFLLIVLLVVAMIRSYFSVIIFSLVIVILLRPVYTFVYNWKWVHKSRISKGLATAITIIGFVMLVAIPVTILVVLTVSQVKLLSAEIDLQELNLADFLDRLAADLERLADRGSVEFDRQEFLASVNDVIRQVINGLLNLILRIGSSFPRLLINGFLFFGFLVTLLPTLDTLLDRERQLLPLESPIVDAYATEIRLMTQSMFVGIFVLSFIQGCAMGIFYMLARIPYAAFWTVLSIAFSVLPLVGVSLIVLPMSIILIMNGDVTSAIIILIGFYGFANWIDTLLRPRLVPKGAYLHPMLLILSVFGGMALAGFLGVVYGPVIMIVFVTTLDLYRTHFLGLDNPEEQEDKRVLPAEQAAIDSRGS